MRSSHERIFKGTGMATKTKAKTATRKPAARKTTVPRKSAAAKAKVPKKKVEPVAKPARATAPAKTPARHAAEKIAPTPAPARGASAESVSLIDKEKPRLKTADHQEKVKRTVLPPISRIRESLAAPAPVAKTKPPVQPTATEPPVDGTAAPAELEVEAQKVIHIK